MLREIIMKLRVRAPGRTVAVLAVLCAQPPAAAAQQSDAWLTASATDHAMAMNAKLLCSGVFVQGRDPDVHVREDLRKFPNFSWADDFAYSVDREARSVTLSSPGASPRTARYNGDQGCAILPKGRWRVSFKPEEVVSSLPDGGELPWPMGDVLSDEALPPEVDHEAIGAALDFAFDDGLHEPDQNTRAVVVVYRGRIIGERYAPGIPRDMPHLSWSQGKSITAALAGVLVQQGELVVANPAPVPEWRAQGDPRADITLADLLHMSSGLEFNRWRLGQPRSLSSENDHFFIYFGTPNVFSHAVNRELEHTPNTVWRYRNSDPLTVGKIVRETVEARGESYLQFPQKHLFDRIGARHFVLETDAWGNFIMTGYDYGTARDWARFGLLHLWDGDWQGDRVLPRGWSEFVSTPAPASQDQGYGGLFWLNRGARYDRIPLDAYWASGFMGQRTTIIPSRDMVVVRLGPSPAGFDGYFNELVGRILDAVAVDSERR
ncbi:MAG: serine hydrolase [Longimicrobiales bacterium]